LIAGEPACLLLHGFTAQPEEMAFLAADLHRGGHTVLTLRLAGHGTRPADLERTRWNDWLLSVEEGLCLLKDVSRRVVLVGQSMGGMIALTAAAQFTTAGVVALSTPFEAISPIEAAIHGALGWLGISLGKGSREDAELGERREAAYPAYARFPAKIMRELARLQQAMREALPRVKVPALVVQSRQDFHGGDDLEKIYALLGSDRKEKLWLDGFDHSIVRDEKRAMAFEAIARFIQSL